jgi:alpha-1,2-mannosyltransferase
VSEAAPSWTVSFLRWLTPRRIRAQAIVLAVCLWGVCAVDFATPGIFDRAANIKFQDFLPFYISAKLVSQHRASEIYDQQSQAKELEKIFSNRSRIRIPFLYPPQVALLFVPLASLPFPVAAGIWIALSLSLYFTCIYVLWRSCPNLHPYQSLIALAAIAFPPLFHFFVRGQFSAVPLACFTFAFLALRRNQFVLSGIALGFLIAKPQFLVAIPLILLFAPAWRILAGLILSSAAQLACAVLYFGRDLMRAYFNILVHPSSWITTAELSQAPIQMHSLRSFWTLLIPWLNAALALYILSSIIVLTAVILLWKSSINLSLKFSALLIASILINPHLFVYDLLALVPALLLLLDWALSHQTRTSSAQLRLVLYLIFLLPLFGPLSRWTHIQLSVIVFAAALWMLRCVANDPANTMAGLSSH